MKSEVMLNAIANIDDKLIEDAEYAKASKKSHKPLYAICAVAACLILVFTFIFTNHRGKPDASLLLNGTVISETPAEIHLPVSVNARRSAPSISLTLSLNPDGDTGIKVSHGTMDICSSDNTKTLFTGTEYTTDKPVNINWFIDGSDINSVYTLTLDEDNVYTLAYNTQSSLWSICKQ